jgi:hypothetical protein
MGTTGPMLASVLPATLGTGLPVILFPSTVRKSATQMALMELTPVSVVPVTIGIQVRSYVLLTAHH